MLVELQVILSTSLPEITLANTCVHVGLMTVVSLRMVLTGSATAIQKVQNGSTMPVSLQPKTFSQSCLLLTALLFLTLKLPTSPLDLSNAPVFSWCKK